MKINIQFDFKTISELNKAIAGLNLLMGREYIKKNRELVRQLRWLHFNLNHLKGEAFSVCNRSDLDILEID